MVCYQDEVHFQLNTTVARKWAPKGSKPKVKSAPGRKNASYSGYVLPSTGELIDTKPSWFNYQTVVESLRQFLLELNLEKDKKVALVIDNAPWHKKAKRLIESEDPQYSDIRDKVAIITLPPYSPDLNPIEQVWRKTRREVTHNRYFKSVEELSSAVDDYFKGFRCANSELSSLCSFKYKY